jgi:Zn ribbon nucleic-acid-binding protein
VTGTDPDTDELTLDTTAPADASPSPVGTPTPPGRRRLVALEHGPLARHWYWLADWTTLRRGDYQPTGRYIDNPDPRHGPGEVWTYTPPAPPPSAQTDAIPPPRHGATPPCPRCGRQAPRLITWRQADRVAPVVECPRCAYPDQHAMPTTDQDWYTTHRKDVTP